MEDDFVNWLESIPWFANLGKPIPSTSRVRQIHDWIEWPGPEDESVTEIASRQQALYDSWLSSATSKDERASAEELWKHIHDVVFRLASPKVPYDSTKDAWHPPSSAVWQAAWTTGLVGLSRFFGHAIPPDLAEEWKWYEEGHWPCAIEDVPGGERLVVY